MPRPRSQTTLKPALTSLATLSGVAATRRSSSAVSLGTPTVSDEAGTPAAATAALSVVVADARGTATSRGRPTRSTAPRRAVGTYVRVRSGALAHSGRSEAAGATATRTR